MSGVCNSVHLSYFVIFHVFSHFFLTFGTKISKLHVVEIKGYLISRLFFIRLSFRNILTIVDCFPSQSEIHSPIRSFSIYLCLESCSGTNSLHVGHTEVLALRVGVEKT